MSAKYFSNEDIALIDWAKQDRAELLRSLHCKKKYRAPNIVASGWDADGAGGDSRSVHAYIVGKGDLRTLWWNL